MALVLGRRRGLVLQQQAPQQQLVVAAPRRRRNRPRNAAALVPVNQLNGARLVVSPNRRPQGNRSKQSRGRRAGARQLGGMNIGAAYSSVLAGGQPVWQGLDRGVAVSNQELFETMNGTNTFSANRWACVPALFPWLSGVAPNFSRFRWTRLLFEFITASPTSQGGSVAMGAGYDVMDQQPTSLAEISAMAHSQLVEVWNPAGSGCRVAFDATRWNQPWYSNIPIPTAGIPPTEARSYQDYIPGWLYFGRATQVNGQTIGHIRVTYTIEFIDPIPISMNVLPSVQGVVSLKEHWGADDVSQDPPDPDEALRGLVSVLGDREDRIGDLVERLDAMMTLQIESSASASTPREFEVRAASNAPRKGGGSSRAT